MHRCKVLWLLVSNPGLKGSKPPLYGYTTDFPGHAFGQLGICITWPDCVAGLQDAFPEMSSYSRQSFICIHKKPHRWNGSKAMTEAGAPGSAYANLPRTTEHSGGTGCLWRKTVHSCIHHRGRLLWQWTSTSPCFGNPSHWQVAMPWLLSRGTMSQPGEICTKPEGRWGAL